MTLSSVESVVDIEFADPGVLLDGELKPLLVERCRNALALRSLRLLAGLVRHHSIEPLRLTCDDGNLPSQRTLEKRGAEFVEIRAMPADDPYVQYYPPESRTKRRYRWTPTPA